MKQSGLRFAFSAWSFDAQEPINDPRYIRYMVILNDCDEIICTRTPYPFHGCSLDEITSFAPPAPDSVDFINGKKADESKSLYCIDWEKYGEELSIFGSFSTSRLRYLSVLLVPCNFVLPEHEEFYPVDKECIRDEKA